MKNKIIPLLVILSVLLTGIPVCAEESAEDDQNSSEEKPVQTIILKDGSVIKGRLVSIANDVYTVQTKNMGQVKINVSQLSSITTGSTAPIAQPPLMPSTFANAALTDGSPMTANRVNQMQQHMLSDPAMQAAVQKIMSDPEIMSLLSDSASMQDIMSMDPNKLMNNPKLMELMQNPKMQEAINKMTQKMMQQQGNAFPGFPSNDPADFTETDP